MEEAPPDPHTCESTLLPGRPFLLRAVVAATALATLGAAAPGTPTAVRGEADSAFLRVDAVTLPGLPPLVDVDVAPTSTTSGPARTTARAANLDADLLTLVPLSGLLADVRVTAPPAQAAQQTFLPLAVPPLVDLAVARGTVVAARATRLCPDVPVARARSEVAELNDSSRLFERSQATGAVQANSLIQ